MLDKDFRQKAIIEGLRQLNSLRSVPGKVCVGVLYDDIVLGNADPKKDFMWFNCKPVSTYFFMLWSSTGPFQQHKSNMSKEIL